MPNIRTEYNDGFLDAQIGKLHRAVRSKSPYELQQQAEKDRYSSYKIETEYDKGYNAGLKAGPPKVNLYTDNEINLVPARNSSFEFMVE